MGYIEEFITNPQEDYRLELSEHINNEFNETKFIDRCTDGSKGAFSRSPTLTLKKLMLFIMTSHKALQRDLDHFYKKINSSDYSIREVTKGAFSTARNKLNEWGFKRLNEVCVDFFYANAPYHKWKGFRLLAVDGSRLQLPNHQSVKEEFGEIQTGRNGDTPRSMATCSLLYDVLNQVTLDAQIGPYKNTSKKKAGELTLFEDHLPKLQAGDLVLLDRGYPSILLFFKLISKQIDFCVRMKGSWWKEVRAFRESNLTQKIVSFELPPKDIERMKKHTKNIPTKVYCRLIKVVLDTGEIEILCTSLTDTEKYLEEEFKALYHLRWNEEEAYKLLKSRIEIERFTGKKAKAIKQDLQAKVFLMSLMAAYAHPIEEKVREEYKADEIRKYDQKINRTNALAMTRDILVGMFCKADYSGALNAFDQIVSKTREVIRPGRKNERKHRPKKPYSMNYKPL